MALSSLFQPVRGLKNLDVTYNKYNLAEEMHQEGRLQARYTWLADGTKLAVEDNDGSGYAYIGSLVYRNDKGTLSLESCSFGAGRIVPVQDDENTKKKGQTPEEVFLSIGSYSCFTFGNNGPTGNFALDNLSGYTGPNPYANALSKAATGLGGLADFVKSHYGNLRLGSNGKIYTKFNGNQRVTVYRLDKWSNIVGKACFYSGLGLTGISFLDEYFNGDEKRAFAKLGFEIGCTIIATTGPIGAGCAIVILFFEDPIVDYILE